jgi:hypothetical protein
VSRRHGELPSMNWPRRPTCRRCTRPILEAQILWLETIDKETDVADATAYGIATIGWGPRRDPAGSRVSILTGSETAAVGRAGGNGSV